MDSVASGAADSIVSSAAPIVQPASAKAPATVKARTAVVFFVMLNMSTSEV